MGNMTEIIHVLLRSLSRSLRESHLIIQHPLHRPSWYTMYCTWYDNKETALCALRATHHPARSHAHKSSLQCSPEPVCRASLLLRPGQGTNTRDTMMAAAWLSGVITAWTLEQCHQPPPICSDDKKVGVKRFFDPTKLPLLVSQIAPDLFTDPFSAPPLLLEYLYRLIKWIFLIQRTCSQ